MAKMNREQRELILRRAKDMCNITKPGNIKIPVDAKGIERLETLRGKHYDLNRERDENSREFYRTMKEVYGYELSEYSHRLGDNNSQSKFPEFSIRPNEKELKEYEAKKLAIETAFFDLRDNLVFEGASNWKQILSDFQAAVEGIKG